MLAPCTVLAPRAPTFVLSFFHLIVFFLPPLSNSGLAEHDPDVGLHNDKVVYIQRNVNSAVRSVANNEDVVEALRDEFGEDVVLVHTGAEPFLDQLLMLARARVVVAAHGAGMANIIVAPEGCRVVMLPMWPMSDHSFIHLPAALGLHVTLLTDIRSYYYGNFGVIADKHVRQIVAAARHAWGEGSGGAAQAKTEL